MLWKERSEAYNNAHVRVSLENMAAKLGQEDACHITPTQIAIEVRYVSLTHVFSYLYTSNITFSTRNCFILYFSTGTRAMQELFEERVQH
ncbi:putative shikimate kinase [Helianthus annuus]|nr:putative shikimate kinase [Helianthus annuus]KAJ0504725.1 putative shikimate kinase [Helianthus annuus]KAJ0674457.1 putative shikimate kinase [Helianthus annuus]